MVFEYRPPRVLVRVEPDKFLLLHIPLGQYYRCLHDQSGFGGYDVLTPDEAKRQAAETGMTYVDIGAEVHRSTRCCGDLSGRSGGLGPGCIEIPAGCNSEDSRFYAVFKKEEPAS